MGASFPSPPLFFDRILTLTSQYSEMLSIVDFAASFTVVLIKHEFKDKNELLS